MEFFTAYQRDLDAARQLIGAVNSRESLPDVVDALTDADVVELVEVATLLERAASSLRLAGSGVISKRSSRESGHSGIAQSRGFRSTVAFIQQITGSSRAQIAKEVRVGEALLASSPASQSGVDGGGSGSGSGSGVGAGAGAGAGGEALEQPREAWHASLDRAVLNETLTLDQHDAIRMGLGEPPEPTAAGIAAARALITEETSSDPVPVEMSIAEGELAEGELAEGELAEGDLAEGNLAEEGLAEGDLAEVARRAAQAAVAEAWSLAAEHLIAEASTRTIEELRKAARAVRDELDPVGAENRFAARYEARSFRMWVDAKGTHHGAFTFDDESAAWVTSVIDAALRPRRGGPRFVDPTEKQDAQALIDDPRTNAQLTHDLLIDVLRSGTLANAAEVMGARQPGVRVVKVVAGGGVERAFVEREGSSLPVWAVGRSTCETGVVPVTVDP